MELALRDQQIYQLNTELEHRKKLLCSQRVMLKNNIKDNSFLKEVAKDYDIYNNVIIKEKQQQMASLQLLNKYIENITSELTITNYKLKESKQEQEEILNEIKHLKHEIDSLVDLD
jgi:hypothetical protein